MIQAPEPQWLEVINGLFKFVGAPAGIALLVIWGLRKVILPKTNGAQLKAHMETLSETHGTQLAAQTKELLHRFDMAHTTGFIQLQKDLSVTIAKETENAMTKALFNMWQARERQ